MSVFTLNVITPQGFFYQGEAKQLNVPAFDGRMGILAHHTALVAALIEGDIDIHTAEEDHKIVGIQSGYVTVVDNKCTILAVIA